MDENASVVDGQEQEGGVSEVSELELVREVVLPREVAPESPEGRALLDGLQRPFNTNERLMLAADYFARYTPSVDAAQRDRMPVRALTIHAGPGKAGELDEHRVGRQAQADIFEFDPARPAVG